MATFECLRPSAKISSSALVEKLTILNQPLQTPNDGISTACQKSVAIHYGISDARLPVVDYDRRHCSHYAGGESSLVGHRF